MHIWMVFRRKFHGIEDGTIKYTFIAPERRVSKVFKKRASSLIVKRDLVADKDCSIFFLNSQHVSASDLVPY